MAADIQSVHNILQKQFEVMLRVGNVGKFMARDLTDRVSALGSALSSNLDRMTEQEKNKYKEFLQTELQKLDKQQREINNKERIDVE
jgi:hypothetical protein